MEEYKGQPGHRLQSEQEMARALSEGHAQTGQMGWDIIFRMNFVPQVVVLLTVAIVIKQGKAQTDEGARCGPFNGWVGCIPSELPECCSQYGFCSDVFNRKTVCAQEKRGIFYDGSKKSVCITDADCRRPDQPGNFFCSQEPQTMGYCGVRNVTVPFTGKNPFVTTAPAKTEPSTQTGNGILHEDKASDTKPVAAPAPAPAAQDTSSTSGYSTFGLIISLLLLFLL